MYTLHSHFHSHDTRKGDRVLNRSVACVEVGASSIQTVLFESAGSHAFLEGAHRPPGHELAIAVPGLIEDDRVLEASNLGWADVDPVEKLGLEGRACIVVNDAGAAALGEARLRGGEVLGRLIYLGLGTGIGGAVVEDGELVAENLFGHMGGFGSAGCACGGRGCLETVAAGWALPTPIDDSSIVAAASSIAEAIHREPLATAESLVVLGGGIARAYPQIVDLVRAGLEGLQVETTSAPGQAKSAAPWGLLHLVSNLDKNVLGYEDHLARASTMSVGGG